MVRELVVADGPDRTEQLMSLLRRSATALAAAVAIIAAAAPALAANGQYDDSNGGGSNYYDNKDPASTGCNQNASLIGTRPVTDLANGSTVATIQIYYSRSCQTNWIRVTGNPYGGPTAKNVFSSLGGWNSEVDDHGNASSYSMMVYAPGTTSIDGDVYLDAPVQGDWYPQKAHGHFTLS